MRKHHWLCAAFVLSFAITSLAQEYTSFREVFQDEALRRDFTIQGEYSTTVDGVKVGLHMIADGGGKFRVVAYVGGLPGDGWKAGEPRLLGTAVVNGNDVSYNMNEVRGSSGSYAGIPQKIEAKGTINIETPQGGGGQGGARQGGGQGGGPGAGQFRGIPVKITVANPATTFVKQFRQSPTLRQEPPAGAVVLFNGTNVDKWEAGAKLNEPQQRAGGAGAGPARNTLWAEATAKPFEKKPYKMHVEFMLSYMPQAQGQARSNSGVYLDERYECQVLDSFGLEGENNECGGFYQVAKPLVNMCFPPLTWQTYDFEFTPARYDGDKKVANARVTVRHNGVLIHNNIEFQKETPGCQPEGPTPRGVYLQGHGNKVQYRNIWIQYQ